MKPILPIVLLAAATATAQPAAELPRTPLVPAHSAEAAVKTDPAQSQYINLPDTQWTLDDDRWSAEFVVPFKWNDRQIFLRVPSFGSPYTVSVNGQAAGESAQYAVPAEFDITAIAKEGRNILSIAVADSPGALEYRVQRGTGKPEGICVIAEPRIRVRDLAVDAGFENGNGLFNLGVVVKSHLLNEKTVRVFYELRSPAGQVVATDHRDETFKLRGEDTVRFYALLEAARPWEPENPQLYTLVVKLQHEGRFTEYVATQVGFRSVANDGGRLTLNGRAVDLSLARMDPTAADIEKQLADLRGRGVNIVRLHHPAPEAFYAACDRTGMLVCAQADIDTHAAGDARTVGANPTNDPASEAAFVERVLAMYHTAKIHPSVVMFSIAENSANGINLYEAYLRLKALETARPVVYPEAGGEWNSDKVMAREGVPLFPHK